MIALIRDEDVVLYGTDDSAAYDRLSREMEHYGSICPQGGRQDEPGGEPCRTGTD